jgi:hypothetical protein
MKTIYYLAFLMGVFSNVAGAITPPAAVMIWKSSCAIGVFNLANQTCLEQGGGLNLVVSGSTWTSPAASTGFSTLSRVKITIQAGGGGGAGSTSAATPGTGGGAGATCVAFLTGLNPSTAYSISIGGAGAAGTATPTNGGNGGATSITINSVTYSASAGSGGSATSGTGGAGGATCSNTTLGFAGGRGDDMTGAATAGGTRGGESLLGHGGGMSQGGVATAGWPATGLGAGGGGGSFASSTHKAGGAGTQGGLIIEWTN